MYIYKYLILSKYVIKNTRYVKKKNVFILDKKILKWVY